MKMSAYLIRLPLLAAVGVLSWALAQSPAPSGVTIRTTTTLVQVGVVALDSKGRPVEGLKKDDFEVFDNGKPQAIAVFYGEGISGAATSPKVTPPAPGVFTNQLVEKPGASGDHYSVILLDWGNTGFRNTARAREKAREMMNRLGPTEKIGLYSFDRFGLKVVDEIGSSTEAILGNLRTLIGKPYPCFQEQLDGQDDLYDDSMQYLGGGRFVCGGNTPLSGGFKEFWEANRIRDTLNAFEGIAAHLAGLPGRKALIWVSSAFPLEIPLISPGVATFGAHIEGERTLTADLTQVVRKLNQAEVSVYPVDARGLTSDGFLGGGSDPVASQIVSTDRFTWPTMDSLADRTGGEAFHGRNDLDVGMQQAVENIDASYTLGFYAPQDSSRAGSHKLTVRSLRPGVKLRYKEGYYVDAPGKIGKDERKEAVAEALTALVDATTIPIDIKATLQKNTLKLRVALWPDALALARKGDRRQGVVEFITRFATEDGKEAAPPVSRRIEFNLTQRTYEAAQRGGLLFSRTLEMPAKAASLRVLVRNDPSGEIGTLTMPVKDIAMD